MSRAVSSIPWASGEDAAAGWLSMTSATSSRVTCPLVVVVTGPPPPCRSGEWRSRASSAPEPGTPTRERGCRAGPRASPERPRARARSEEHTSELQSRGHLVCRLLLEKKKIRIGCEQELHYWVGEYPFARDACNV